MRKFFWSLFSRKVHLVTCLLNLQWKNLELHIFPKEKLKLLYDPVLNIKFINNQKNVKIEKKFIDVEYILGIGRLTKQKTLYY